ncbi:MAG TPA: ABC transporter ATP-binding protein [Chloroflexi bacterium]|nr:ABC transporter ATP-binding protein [Chloroflexota bacterium]
MIEAKQLTKHFDDFIAVDHIDFRVNPGEVLVLLGPNGAGKTTTVRMLTSIIRPTFGDATIQGYSVINDPDQVRRNVGVLTEHHGLYQRMNAINYLAFFAQLYGLDHHTYQPRIEQLLSQFGLYQIRNKRLGEYSKGMRQKLALARALLHHPPVLLLDEPTSAMDPASARMVRDAILQLRSEDRAIVLCTHNLNEAEELADHIAIIHNGKILHNATPAELKMQMVGQTQYLVRYSHAPHQWAYTTQLPGVQLTSQDDHTLTFSIEDPPQQTPLLLSELIGQGLSVIECKEVNRSLEQAYLQVVSMNTEKES